LSVGAVLLSGAEEASADLNICSKVTASREWSPSCTLSHNNSQSCTQVRVHHASWIVNGHYSSNNIKHDWWEMWWKSDISWHGSHGSHGSHCSCC
jgi:hypothetical protein